MTDAVCEAMEYASLIADICKLTPGRENIRDLEQEVFQRLGWETTINGRGYMMRKPGESHWQSQPQILRDFGTAVLYTVGHRYGHLDHPLERNWYTREMRETSEPVNPTGTRIAAWAVSLAKSQKLKNGQFANHRQDATAITPAAALVAAWLRTHP